MHLKNESQNIKLEPSSSTQHDEGPSQEQQPVEKTKACPFNPKLLKRVRRMDRCYTYTGIAALLTPLNCAPIPLSSDSEDDEEMQRMERAIHPTLAPSTSSTATLSFQNHPHSFGPTNQINAPVGQMEGHSSLASYSHHHQPQHSQEFQNAQPGAHPYYQQHHFGAGSSGGPQQMMYGNEYDQQNQASTSSGPPGHSMHQQYHHQGQQHLQYDQQQQNVRYEHLPPHSAPPQQRNFVPQYPVKVVENAYGQVNRTVNAPPPIVTKPLPPPAPPPSAPPTMTPTRKTPPSFLKRQPDAQEQRRLDYEVAKNVSQIMSKNGMKVTQEPMLASPKALPSFPGQADKQNYQCPTCNRNLANARNLQRHRQTCGSSTMISSPLPTQQPHQITQQNAPQLAAMLQRSPPAPSASAPPPQHHQLPQSAPSTSSFQHHHSAGNLGMALAQQQQNALYSPHDMNDPNAFFGGGFELKDDPMLFQGPSTGTLWSREDSFQSDPHSAPHDQLDLSDPLGFNDPLHHLETLDPDVNKEEPREFREGEELATLDPNPQPHNQFYGIGIDPELEIPLSLDVDEPLTRPDSPSSQGRETPMYQCESCKKTVQSERSLRRHWGTCKAFLSDAAINGEEFPPPTTKRKAGAAGGKRAKKTKTVQEEVEGGEHSSVLEKNGAILAALRKEPTVAHGSPYPHSSMPMNAKPSVHPFQQPYTALPTGRALPSISTSWLSNNSIQPSPNSQCSSGMFTPPMASSTPFPFQKSSPLEELLNEDEPAADEDGDSRSSSGTASTRNTGNTMYACEYCGKHLCSTSNLKRHRQTCKAAPLSLPVSNPSSQPATPAPPASAPPTAPASLPPLETTATVTYTKTNVSGGTNTWSNDKGQLVSPKQKIQPSAVVTHADTQSGVGSSGTPLKAALTVGEALRAQHHKQRMASMDQQQQQQLQMQNQQRFQQQVSQNQAHTSPARIPPRPPNPILNQIQNPPQQVHQQQVQQMASSRQAPNSQHQIVTKQLPPLPNPVLHSQLQLQSPPKKGVIELKHTELVHITSEPLPAPAQERRTNFQGPVHVAQHQHQQQLHQNGGKEEQMKFQQVQSQQETMDQKRRSSEGQVGQNSNPLPLPPIQLPQRQPPQQQHQTQVSAYQVQFNGRPLPPMQLPPKKNLQNVQNNQYQMQPQQQQQHQQQHQMNLMNQHQQHQQHLNQNHLMSQQHQQMQMNPQQMQPNQQHHQQQMNPNLSMSQQPPQQMQMNSPHQHQQMSQNHPMNQQHQTMQMQQQQPMMRMNTPQQHQMHPSAQQMQQHQQQDLQNHQMNQPQLPQQNPQQHQMDPNFQQPPQFHPQMLPQQRPQHGPPQSQQQQPQMMSRKTSLPQDPQPPPAKRGRSQSAVVKPIFEAPAPINDGPPRAPGSPLDSIITSVPLSVEVANHHPPPGVVPEQGQSSAESQSTAPSPRKAHNQAYICPECEKIYSCRKNVKRHRMAVHKMTLEEVLAKPEQPASDEQAASVGVGRRHTVAGTESEKSAVPKNGGAKRKASSAATTAKKGKGKEVIVADKPTILEEPMEQDSSVAPKNDPLPSAQTLTTLASVPALQPVPKGEQSPLAQVSPARVATPQSAPQVMSLQTPLTPVLVASEESTVQVLPREAQQLASQTPAQNQVLTPHQMTSIFQFQASETVAPMQQAVPTPLPSQPLKLPSIHLFSQQEPPSDNANPMPNSAPPTTLSDAPGKTRNGKMNEKEVKAMAQIANELKRSAEGFPHLPPEPTTTENGQELDEDEQIIKRIRQGGVLEDVGDVSAFLDTPDAADGPFSEEMIDSALGQLPPLSTSSSVGLPSLSSPEEHFLQQQQQQQQFQQYHQQQVQMWNEGYQQQHPTFPQQNADGFMQEQHMIQQHQDPMQHQVPMQMPQNMFQNTSPEMARNMMQNYQPPQQVQQSPHHQFQEPVQRPASQPVPLMRPGRRPSAVPKDPAALTCTGCKRVLGSEYSLRRHRVTCADVQQSINPEYPRPPQRRAARKATIRCEAEILASNPKTLDPQALAERRAAAAEAVVGRMGALPPPSVVYEVVDEIQKNLDENKRRNQSTSPPQSEEHHRAPGPVTSMSSSSSSSSSSSCDSDVQGGVDIKIQARYKCQTCNKYYSSEMSLDRHKRESCSVSAKAHAYEPNSPEDEIAIVFTDNSKRRVSRTLLRGVSSLISYWLGDSGNRLELDTKWEHFQLLLDVHTLRVAITAENLNLVAEQSKKYQLEQVVRMAEQFRMQMNFNH